MCPAVSRGSGTARRSSKNPDEEKGRDRRERKQLNNTAFADIREVNVANARAREKRRKGEERKKKRKGRKGGRCRARRFNKPSWPIKAGVKELSCFLTAVFTPA